MFYTDHWHTYCPSLSARRDPEAVKLGRKRSTFGIIYWVWLRILLCSLLICWICQKFSLFFYFSVVTKAFHTAGMLLDVCSIFGEPSEDQVNKLTDFYLVTRYSDLQGENLHNEFHSMTSMSTTKKDKCQPQNIGELYENLDVQNEVIIVL
jgi:hypothetical protein